jgi:hypothetical protein
VKAACANANAFVFDTWVVVNGSGTINLKIEEMDLKLKPEPKDRGIGSLRTPLHIKGTFSEPDVGRTWASSPRAGRHHRVGHPQPLLAILADLEEGKARTATAAS